MRCRALVVLLLIVPAVGCFGDEGGPRLMEPTDKPFRHVLPTVTPTTPTRPTAYNTSDPGLNITTRWHIGDGWDWGSNTTPARYRTERVVDRLDVNGTEYYRLRVTSGIAGAQPDLRDTWFVNGVNWTLDATIDSSGRTHEFDPPRPLRFARNATFSYNETYLRLNGTKAHDAYFTASFLEPTWELVKLPWGNEAAAKVVQDVVLRIVQDRAVLDQQRYRFTFWWDPEYANPIQFAIDDSQWTLKAADVGGKRYGILQPT